MAFEFLGVGWGPLQGLEHRSDLIQLIFLKSICISKSYMEQIYCLPDKNKCKKYEISHANIPSHRIYSG
jgi:hypothetical protein